MKLSAVVGLQFCVYICALQPYDNNVTFKRGTMNPTADFKQLTKCTTFVDKTKLIVDFFKYSAPREYQLITCPHGFGKTVNIDMLKSFIGEDADYEFFHQSSRTLKIASYLNNKTDFYHNNFKQYSVVHVSFKVTGASTYGGIVEMLSKNFKNFNPLVDLLTEISKENDLKTIMRKSFNRSFYPNSKTFLLIDDYDSPIINAIEHNINVSRVMEFIETNIFTMLNTRDYLNVKYVLITGTLNVLDKKKFASFKHRNFLDDHHFLKYFGFTEKEVDKLFDRHGVSDDDKKTVKQFYKGYDSCPSSKRIYNPLSIVSYLSYRNPNGGGQGLKNYWSADSLILNFLRAFKENVKLQELLNEVLTLKKITFNMKKIWSVEDLEELKMLTHEKTIELTDHRVDLILSYLFHHGYLTHTDQANVYGLLYDYGFEKSFSKSDDRHVLGKDEVKKLFFK